MHLRSCALAPSVLCIGLKTWMRGKNDTWSMSDRLSTVRVAWTPRRLPQTNGRVEEAAKMLRCSFNGPERRRLAGSGRSTKPDVEVRRSLRTRQRKIAAPACFRHDAVTLRGTATPQQSRSARYIEPMQTQPVSSRPQGHSSLSRRANQSLAKAVTGRVLTQ